MHNLLNVPQSLYNQLWPLRRASWLLEASRQEHETSGHHFKGIRAVKKKTFTKNPSKSYEFFKLFSFNMQFFLAGGWTNPFEKYVNLLTK